MAQVQLSELGRDHKHWLAELERWQGYVRLWQQQQATLMQDIERVITDHRQKLGEHARSLEHLQHTIADCERALSGPPQTEPQMHHDIDSRLHDQQLTVHEQLKATHHRLMLALAMLKGEPFREE